MSQVTLSEQEVIDFTIKVLRDLYPNLTFPREKITPRIAAWVVYISEEMLIASALITFFEEAWKSTFPGYTKITQWKDITDFLKDSAKTAVKSYLKGGVKLMVQGAVKIKWRSIVQGYFGYDGVMSDTDFIPQKGFGDRLRELGLKHLR